MSYDMNTYTMLTQNKWRVEMGDRAPDLNLDKVQQEFKVELAKFNLPVVSQIENMTNPDGRMAQKLVFRDSTANYALYPTFLTLENYGHAVFAVQQNCLNQAPEFPEGDYEVIPEIPSRNWIGTIVIVLVGVFALFQGSIVGFFIGLSLIGLPIFLYINFSPKIAEAESKAQIAKAKNSELDTKRNQWLKDLETYDKIINSTLLNTFDNRVFMMRDTIAQVMKNVLQKMYPGSNVGDVEKDDNTSMAKQQAQQVSSRNAERRKSMAELVAK